MKSDHRIWRASLVLFILAGLTGVLYRSALALGWGSAQMAGLDLGNIRHAHSHLMYFGWATPALMLFISMGAARNGTPINRSRPIVYLVLFLALLAYPPFLLWGYSSASFGTTRLPVSVIFAGLNVIGWYAFVVEYVRMRLRNPEASPQNFKVFDLAVLFLVLSTLGAWGLPVIQIMRPDNEALMSALTHLFLDTFADGWFVFGVLGLAMAATRHRANSTNNASRILRPVYAAAIGVPFTFALAMPSTNVPALWQALSRVGTLAVGVGLILAATILWNQCNCQSPRRSRSWIWRIALGMLVAKSLAQLVVALSGDLSWTSQHGLRVLYLHLQLLGFVTLGLIATADTLWTDVSRRSAFVMASAIVLLLMTLIPLTPLFPAALRGNWVFTIASIGALFPVVGALFLLATQRANT